MKTFNQWFEGKYYEAMTLGDYETSEMLLDNREMIEYGYNQALEHVKKTEIMVEVDEVN